MEQRVSHTGREAGNSSCMRFTQQADRQGRDVRALSWVCPSLRLTANRRRGGTTTTAEQDPSAREAV